MYLHYFRGPNFGDALNPWLWPKKFGALLNGEKDVALVGIGTILGPDIPEEPKKLVLGSGAGYGPAPIISTDNWEILAVRGPLTAHALKLPYITSVTDSAALLATVDLPPPDNDRRPVFMPHWTSANYFRWPDLCRDVGIRFVDPGWDVEEVIGAIRGTNLVIAEAMHGAIVADTLRVPWIPVQIYNHINQFKWADWCLSMNQSYQPLELPALFSEFSIERNLFSDWKRGDGLYGKFRRLPQHAKWTAKKLTYNQTTRRKMDNFREKLLTISSGVDARLSQDSLFDEKVARLQEAVEYVKKKY